MSKIDPCQNQLGMLIMYECANSILALCQGHIKCNGTWKQDLLVKELVNAVLLISQFFYFYYTTIPVSSPNSKLVGSSFALETLC